MRKELLTAALDGLLAAFDLPFYLKAPAAFIASFATQMSKLPDSEKVELAESTEQEKIFVLSELDVVKDLEITANELGGLVEKASHRMQFVEKVYDLSAPAIDQLVTLLPGASQNVSRTAPTRTRASELVEWIESTEGPGFSRAWEILQVNFQKA